MREGRWEGWTPPPESEPSVIAAVAIRTLRALKITDREMIQLALLLWMRPSPPLSINDVVQVMTYFDREREAASPEATDEPST